MDREYEALEHKPPGAEVRVASTPAPSRLTLESPALDAMTDFTRTRAATIRATPLITFSGR